MKKSKRLFAPKERYDDYLIVWHGNNKRAVCKTVIKQGYIDHVVIGETDTYSEALALIRVHKMVGA